MTTAVTAHCPCGQSETITEHDRDAALDALDTLGWTDLDTTPLCPTCAVGYGTHCPRHDQKESA